MTGLRVVIPNPPHGQRQHIFPLQPTSAMQSTHSTPFMEVVHEARKTFDKDYGRQCQNVTKYARKPYVRPSMQLGGAALPSIWGVTSPIMHERVGLQSFRQCNASFWVYQGAVKGVWAVQGDPRISSSSSSTGDRSRNEPEQEF